MKRVLNGWFQDDRPFLGIARTRIILLGMGIQCSIKNTQPCELVIEDAPPQIQIQADSLVSVALTRSPHIRLTPPSEPPESFGPMTWVDIQDWHQQLGARPEGGLLRIEASNRTLIYRITGYLMQPDLFTAEWPD